MRKMTIQFHATLEEIVGYANLVKSEFDLVVTLANFRPFALKIIEGDLTVHDLDDGRYRIIVFTKFEPVTNAASQTAFYDLNPGVVELGFRLNHIQNATSVASATADRKFLASLS